MNFLDKLLQIFSKPQNTDANDMNHLIVGLGNIGSEYAGTRHNIGFTVLDAMAETAGETFQDKRYGFVAEMKVKNQNLILLKPST
jgi:PTH1 family peptidyl-tRNA hydrolase